MDLMHNQVIRVAAGELKGLYRVVMDESDMKSIIAVRLDADGEERSKSGRKKKATTKRPRKKSPARLVGALLWLPRAELEEADRGHHLLRVEAELDSIFFLPTSSLADQKIFETRKEVMKDFLIYQTLRESILQHAGLGGLVKSTVASTKVSRSLIYKLWSQLCRYGFSEMSLRPMRDKCGAPGVMRPCDPGGRQKAGRKTAKQRMAARAGIDLPPEQPGMSTNWRNRILAADLAIPRPKPEMPARCTMILNSHFMTRFEYVDGKPVAVSPERAAKLAKQKKADGKVVEVLPEKGAYPNRAQIRRVLEVGFSRLERLAQRTTAGHFKRNMRGLVARSWKGVAGPGHTWAIDSTIGDIYLCSSVNRAWLIGRPVVYIICDVWSTVVVGFYVCLQGPSWNMAKLALFSAGAEPELIGDLWGYHALQTLTPAPTLPAVLLCDRGEYLSRAASQTGVELLPNISYAPPYRPDMKGDIEVLHRIMKDHQRCDFIPGAIDARRKELEMRKFNPNDAVFTTRDFVHYLHTVFTNYNLNANREHRLDAHMKAAGVFPSPAGLWAWGHRMGVGFRRAVPQSELITSLLVEDTARVSRNGVMRAGMHYGCPAVDEQQWTARARNFGGWDIPCYHYPGSVSRLWTPNSAGQGFLELKLSEQSIASAELTFDEVADAFAYGGLNRADVEHVRSMGDLNTLRTTEELRAEATAKTNAAHSRYAGPKPTMSAARKLEGMAQSVRPPEDTAPPVPPPGSDEAEQAYLNMMQTISAAANEEAEHD